MSLNYITIDKRANTNQLYYCLIFHRHFAIKSGDTIVFFLSAEAPLINVMIEVGVMIKL